MDRIFRMEKEMSVGEMAQEVVYLNRKFKHISQQFIWTRDFTFLITLSFYMLVM